MQRKFKENRILYFPTDPKSLANYLLLKNDLLSQQILGTKKYKQLVFNKEFLYSLLHEHNELHCEFCGKSGLIIYDWFDRKKDNNLMATADHFFPKSLNKKLLAFELNNMVCCCQKCNNQKADKIVDISEIKYPYPETINKLEKLNFKIE